MCHRKKKEPECVVEKKMERTSDQTRNTQEMNTYQKIYEVVKKIPKGFVASYGQVAELAGNPHWSRIVGYALHVNPDPAQIPCHRVVTKDGCVSKAFAFGGANEQVARLKAEGVGFDEKGHVEMEKYQMRFFG